MTVRWGECGRVETTWARTQPRGEEEGILQGGVASSVQWGAGVGVRERPV